MPIRCASSNSSDVDDLFPRDGVHQNKALDQQCVSNKGSDINEGNVIPGLPPEVRGYMTTGNCPLIDSLKARLAITTTQKSAWDDYAGALKSNLKTLQGMRETLLPMRGKTLIEEFDAHVTAMENRLKALNDLKPTLTSLYAVLSVDQKKRADEFLLGMSCMM
jgi:hypothetical protein